MNVLIITAARISILKGRYSYRVLFPKRCEQNKLSTRFNLDRLREQMKFIIEVDKLKTILRRNYIADGSKLENDAEHSWFFSLAALVLGEHSNNRIDVGKVIRMAIIHDIVEVYAGDTFIYDDKGRETQKEREQAASQKIFGILPSDQEKYFLDLWNEFEDGITDESKFAKSIDRLAAVILNINSNGKSWRENKVEFEKVYRINQKIDEGSSVLWSYVRELLESCRDRGLFY